MAGSAGSGLVWSSPLQSQESLELFAADRGAPLRMQSLGGAKTLTSTREPSELSLGPAKVKLHSITARH
jgi:hypothetical protein